MDDERLAARRAQTLAERGYGDAAIRFALARDGLAGEVVTDAVLGLEPEADRARRLLDQHGGGPRAVRRLAARGFDPGTLDDALGFADEA